MDLFFYLGPIKVLINYHLAVGCFSKSTTMVTKGQALVMFLYICLLKYLCTQSSRKYKQYT